MFFLCALPLMKWQGVANIFHARCVILMMSVYSLFIARECSGNRDAQSRNVKEIYFMLSNNKFLRKCWYGRYPWIWLAVECESMVEKGINFIFCLGTAYDISSMESVGNYSVVFVDGKVCLPKKLSLNLSFELWHLYKSLLPSAKGLSFLLYAIFIFIRVSIFSFKAPTREQYSSVFHEWIND